MPVYVYRCANGHEKEVTHSMKQDPSIICKVCGDVMKRKPQAFRWYMNPTDVLLDHMDDKYREWRVKKQWQQKQKT